MKYRSFARFVLEGLEGVAVTLFVIPTWPVARRWLKDWGAADAERARTWPGDKLVSDLETTHTRAISVDAAPSKVWPWVVQFGLDRAGFYSYELFERMVGIPVRNVEEIVSDFQKIAVGDEVKLHPDAPGIPVGLLDPEKHICFGRPPGGTPPDDLPDPNLSWSIYLVAADGEGSRLVLRSCVEPLRHATLGKRLALALEAPIDFVMEQRMLRSMKRLAERAK
jgi:hypothetical protein